MPELKNRLSLTLFLLRLGVFVVLFTWAMGKFFNPVQAARIYSTFYSIKTLDLKLVYVAGSFELLLALAFLFGVLKRLNRGLVLLIAGISALAPGRFYLHPFQDHILLYFASLPFLAACFALYILRDYDVLGTFGPAPEFPPGNDRFEPVSRALLALRLGMFAVMFVWTLDKFVNPTQTARIFSNFYSVKNVGYSSIYVLGVLQLAIDIAFLAGIRKRATRAIVLLLHMPSALAPGRLYLHPFQEHTLLFFAAFPMVATCFALYYLRDQDVLWIYNSGRPGELHSSKRRWWRRPPQLATGVALAMAFYIGVISCRNWKQEKAQEPSVIASIQQRYIPAHALLAQRADMARAEWNAVMSSANCTFGRPAIENCWEVSYSVNVPGPRKVEAGWIIDMNRIQIEPNAGARAMFSSEKN